MTVDSLEQTFGVLRGAMSLLARGWCHGVWAQDAAGMPCGFSDEDAICFSLPGALCRAAGDDVLARLPLFERLADFVAAEHEVEAPLSKLMRWNDAQPSLERVLDALERYARHSLAEPPRVPHAPAPKRAAK